MRLPSVLAVCPALVWLLAWVPTGMAAAVIGTTPSAEYASSEFVFAGVCKSAKLLDPGKPRVAGYHPSLVTFRVTAVWKGSIGRTIRVRTPSGRFEVGARYLVYARVSERSEAHSDQCGRVRRVEDALWDRYWLPEATGHRRDPSTSKVTLDDLFEGLGSREARTRSSAAEALCHAVEARPLIVSRLRRVVVGDEPGDHVAAMTALRSMGHAASPAEPELVWVLRNAAGKERAAALEALSRVAQRDSFDRYVMSAFSDTSSELLAKACKMAWRLSVREADQEGAGKALLRLVRHPSWEVRFHAVRSLGYFPSAGTPALGTIDDLRRNDPNPLVRGSARGCWGTLTGLDPWERVRLGSSATPDSAR